MRKLLSKTAVLLAIAWSMFFLHEVEHKAIANTNAVFDNNFLIFLIFIFDFIWFM